MASKLVYTLVVFTAAIAFVSCQNLLCYDCDPQNYASDCADPEKTNTRTSPCTPDVQNGTAICLSAYLNVTGGNGNLTGIYRGCQTLRPDVADFCDWFKQERNNQNLTVVSCIACNATRCNSVRFKDDGTSGAETWAATVFVLFINTVFVLLLRVFE